MYNFRTDLALERRDLYNKAHNIEKDIDGIENEEEKINDNIIVSRVKVTNENGEQAIGKPQGNYITIDIKRVKNSRGFRSGYKRIKSFIRQTYKSTRANFSSRARKYICYPRCFGTQGYK